MSVTVTRGARPGELVVRDGERIARMFGVVAGDVTWIFHDGAVFRLEDDARLRRGQHTHGSLSSPMPATVVGVNVSPGDDVTAGQILIVLEAMKMELPIRAPGAGRVAAVHCAPGDLVQADISLVDLE